MIEDGKREGSLEAPTRHPLDWQNPAFYDQDDLFKELERVFDICHGCRRCFSLCNAFAALFDAIDESDTMELDGVDKKVYWDVVDHCYLCDMCFMTKCPYVPPHPWNVDFPKLMLRAKAVKFEKAKTKIRDRVLTSTDKVGKLAGIPVVAPTVNVMNKNALARKVIAKILGVHENAALPTYHSRTLRKRARTLIDDQIKVSAVGHTRGRVVLFATCYGNYNEPNLGEDLIAVFQHNEIAVRLADKERCCGMPKLELGDLKAITRAKDANIPVLAKLVDEGYDIVAPIPSCVLMFKQELPLIFPGDADVTKVSEATYDPFEYLMLRHKEGKLKHDFKQSLGKISYHVPCHLRVQNIGLKTREALELVPDTKVEPIERCSGHNGTYAVKKEFHETSMRIGRPVVQRIEKSAADYYSSDCPMAGHQIENGLKQPKQPDHPMALLRKAYDI
ncbi:MAG: heterodisulfide reductase-related iron-sulfur binding cluster [Gammaproteobacteria bacterium]|nr:heterodisulfide reductase-related iron-sulfur binding cluster [Gammaproteobacteria bacterium]